MKFWLLRSVMRALSLLPWSWLRVLGGALGILFWRFDTREKQITQANIALCLPELSAQQQQQLTRASLLDFGRTILEMPKLWLTPPAAVLAQLREIDGEALLRAQLARQRGVIILAPHHGNWEIVGLYLGLHYDLTTMYLPSQGEAIDTLVRTSRARSGSVLVPADASGVRGLLKALKRGGLAGILPDQVPKLAGAEFAPFFGQPALTMTLACNLLQKTGAGALVVAALRLPEGGFKLVFREPDPLLYAPDLAQALTGLNRSIEACVREHPEQYQWEYKRFKGQPKGMPAVY